MCWRYRKYAPLDAELEKLEKDAREVKKGLWVEPNPVPPWEWRKRKGSNDAQQGAAPRGQDAITGQDLRRVVGHIRATRYSKIERGQDKTAKAEQQSHLPRTWFWCDSFAGIFLKKLVPGDLWRFIPRVSTTG